MYACIHDQILLLSTLQIALQEFSAIFWVDSSFRLTGTDLSGAYRDARKNGGYAVFVK